MRAAALSAILLPCLALPALAQADPANSPPEGSQGQTPPRAEPPRELTARSHAPRTTLTLSGSYTASANLDDGPGDVSIARAGLSAEIAFPIEARRSLSLIIGAEESWYDFSDATGLEASTGEPFSDVTEASLALLYLAPLNDTTSYFALASVGYAGESGAEFDDSIVYMGAVGFTTKVSDTFSWGLGVGVATRLEDNALILPLPQITWKISDRWTLASERAGVRLSYAASDALTYGLHAEYDSRTFRLDKDGPLPSAVVTDRRVPVGFFLDYKPTPNVRVGAEVGAALLTNFDIIDENGDDITDDDADPAVYAGLSVRISF